jgi:hypothetical protein
MALPDDSYQTTSKNYILIYKVALADVTDEKLICSLVHVGKYKTILSIFSFFTFSPRGSKDYAPAFVIFGSILLPSTFHFTQWFNFLLLLYYSEIMRQ